MINSHALRQARKNGEYSTKMPQEWIQVGRILTIIGLLALIMVILQSCAMANPSVEIPIISAIESSHNANAYNKHSQARGLCQITPIVLKEFNQFNKRNWSKDDLFIDQVNLLVADWYMNYRIPALLKHYKLADTVKNRLWAYNGGIGNVVKNRMVNETKNYIVKYNKLLKEEL